jgi:hypothetical protein
VTDWILGPKATARFAPPLKPDPKRTGQWRPAVELELGFEFRGTDVRDAGQSPAVRIASQSGNTQAIVGSGRPRLRYDRFRTEGRGISVFDLDAKWLVREALPSGDFSFTQSAVTFGMTSTFGFRRSTDFLLRYRQGFGVSNGQTPLFQLLRLGGADSVRGMEQGEVVGRVMSFNQSEAGVALQPILDLFRHPKPLDPKAPKTAPSPMPFNLATTYIKLLYDRGFARDSASTADILKISHATHGYGAAVEVAGLMILKRRAALTIGYARSPGSYLHRSGLVITGISIDP